MCVCVCVCVCDCVYCSSNVISILSYLPHTILLLLVVASRNGGDSWYVLLLRPQLETPPKLPEKKRKTVRKGYSVSERRVGHFVHLQCLWTIHGDPEK